jgi:hypothetical protein
MIMNILDTIAEAAKNKEVTVYQVVEAFNKGVGTRYHVEEKTAGFNLVNIIGSIGGLFLFLGLGFYMSFYWENFNSLTRLILSLGIGLVLFYIMVYINKQKPNALVSSVLIPVSFMWLNWGTYYNLMQSSYTNSVKEWLYIITIGVLAIVYYLLFNYFKKSMFFTAFNIMYVGTWIGLIDKAFRELKIEFNSYQMYISLMAIAVSGLLIHNYYYKSLNSIVRGLNLTAYYGLLLIPIVGLFAKANANFDKLPKPAAFLELVTVLVFIGWYYIAIKSQSRLLVIINSIGLYFWLTYIYSRFFSSLDFGLTLIISGLMLIGVSYFTWRLNSNINTINEQLN